MTTLILLAMATVLFVWAGWTLRDVKARDEVRAELEADRATGAALVDTLRRQMADALASETTAEELIQELVAVLKDSTHQTGCHPSEGKHTEWCLRARAAVSKAEARP